MAQHYNTVKVLNQTHVAPPPGSVSTATTTIPLTFLDVTWLFCCPMNRLMFYELPSSSSISTQNKFIPHNLQHSLSLTLPHFFPLAGNLTCPPPPNKPYIQYNDGDSVHFTVAESDADFHHLVSNHARDNTAFAPLVPKLPFPITPSDKTHVVVPVMAVQVTLFPSSGISIGISFFHVAADGRSFNHFMKYWASIYKSVSGGQVSLPRLPCHDKGLIKDLDGLLSIYFKDWWSVQNPDGPDDEKAHVDNNVRVTLVLSRDQIDKLKRRLTSQIRNDTELHVSTFVVTSALMWVNMVKLQEGNETSGHLQDDPIYHFVPVADCRESFEFPVPATYFGNCLAFLFVSAKRSELMRKDGIIFAAKAIGRKICELKKGALIGAEKWMSTLNRIVKTGRVLAVAGSPKLGVYETDFGWGSPKKIEFVHMGAYGSFSIAECRGEEGAIEIGLVIGRDKLDLFNVVIEQALNFNCI